MSFTFANIQLELARMVGRSTAADLDDDLTLCKQVINETYLQCYAPFDGVRPRWARRPFAFMYRAPSTQTLTMTNGSNVVTGGTFTTDMVGSIISIGSRWFTYVGNNGTNDLFLEPWPDVTGAQSATVYHNSYPLDASIVEVLRVPEAIGLGPLSPMAGRESEVLYRSHWRDDFFPLPGGGFFRTQGLIPLGTSYQTGNPMFYRVDDNSMQADAVILSRFIVLPLPDKTITVSFEANVVPKVMSADGDIPRLPADVVETVFMPIVRGRWALSYRKYTGENRKELEKLMQEAQQTLKTMAKPQRRTPVTIRAGYL